MYCTQIFSKVTFYARSSSLMHQDWLVPKKTKHQKDHLLLYLYLTHWGHKQILLHPQGIYKRGTCPEMDAAYKLKKIWFKNWQLDINVIKCVSRCVKMRRSPIKWWVVGGDMCRSWSNNYTPWSKAPSSKSAWNIPTASSLQSTRGKMPIIQSTFEIELISLLLFSGLIKHLHLNLIMIYDWMILSS